LAVLKLAVSVSGVLALAKLGFLNFITGRFDTGCFGVHPNFCYEKNVKNGIFAFKVNMSNIFKYFSYLSFPGKNIFLLFPRSSFNHLSLKKIIRVKKYRLLFFLIF
jgi:hypothetical protein